MELTQGDIKSDLNKIINCLSKDDTPLASPLRALKISALYPFGALLINALGGAYVYLHREPIVEIIVGLAAMLFFAVIMTAVFYGNVLVYLSLPVKARNDSLVVNSLQKTYKKLLMGGLLMNLIVTVIACTNLKMAIAVPVVFMIGFLLIQAVIGLEMTRYGVGAVMEKAAALIKKI